MHGHGHRHHGEGKGRRYARDNFGFGPGGTGRGGFGGGHPGRRHGGWGGGRRMGRMFDQGDLRYLVLKMIADKPRHGYELIKAIEERFGGFYSPSPGVIYPTLQLLDDLGYTGAATSEGTKKLFAITAAGEAFLAENKAQVDAVFARVEEAGRLYGSGLAPEIRRAVQNLRMALSVRLDKGPLSDDQVRLITATLDRAAQDIGQA